MLHDAAKTATWKLQQQQQPVKAMVSASPSPLPSLPPLQGLRDAATDHVVTVAVTVVVAANDFSANDAVENDVVANRVAANAAVVQQQHRRRRHEWISFPKDLKLDHLFPSYSFSPSLSSSFSS